MLCDADILRILVEGFEEYNMSPVALENSENSSTIIRFEGTNESDCSLSVITAAGRIVVQRVIGMRAIAQEFHYKDIDKDFFELMRDHYDSIQSLIKMRDGLLGKK